MDAVFGHGPDLLWWQECARAALIFVYGLLLVRLAGRRAFGRWAALDIVVAVTAGSNLSRALTGNAPLIGTLAATALLMALHYVVAHLAARIGWVSRLAEGRPVELGRGGRVEEKHLLRHAVTQNDLEEALRQSGVESVGRTRRVVLEPSGKVTVIKAE